MLAIMLTTALEGRHCHYWFINEELKVREEAEGGLRSNR